MASCEKCGTKIKLGFLGNSLKIEDKHYCKPCGQSAELDLLEKKINTIARPLFSNMRKLIEVDSKEVSHELINYELIDLVLYLIKSNKKLGEVYEICTKVKLNTTEELHAKLQERFPNADLNNEIPLVWLFGIIQSPFLLTNTWLHISSDTYEHMKISLADVNHLGFKTKIMRPTDLFVDETPLGGINLEENKKIFIKFMEELFSKKTACKNLVYQNTAISIPEVQEEAVKDTDSAILEVKEDFVRSHEGVLELNEKSKEEDFNRFLKNVRSLSSSESLAPALESKELIKYFLKIMHNFNRAKGLKASYWFKNDEKAIKTSHNLLTSSFDWIDSSNEVPLYEHTKTLSFTAEHLLTNKFFYIKGINGRISLPDANKIEIIKPAYGSSYKIVLDGHEIGATKIDEDAAEALNNFFKEIYSSKSNYFSDLSNGKALLLDKDLDLKQLGDEKKKSRTRAEKIEHTDKIAKEEERTRKLAEQAQEKARRLAVLTESVKAFEDKYGKSNTTEFRGVTIMQGITKEIILSRFGEPTNTKREVLKTKIKEILSYEPIHTRGSYMSLMVCEEMGLSSEQGEEMIKMKLENDVLIGWEES